MRSWSAILATGVAASLALSVAASLALSVAASLALTATAAAATPQQTIAELNAERAANQLPAGITENPAWSTDCAEHDRYMALNHTLTHVEDPTAPGYTKGGAFAGPNAVLIQSASWDNGDPYRSAPLHLDQLLAPRLAVTGAADVDGYSCTITFPGYIRPAPAALTIYTVPGNGTMTAPSELASEQPWTPGDLVGLSQPQRTGPYLTVLVDAPGQSPIDNPATLSNATVTGPSGQSVAVKTVDGNTPVPSGSEPELYPYISPGGFIIPVAPLLAGTTYHAQVDVTFDGTTTPYDWSFTTRGNDPQSALTANGDELSFTSRSPAPIHVTVIRANGKHAPAVTIPPRHNAHLKLDPGSWQVCGHQPATNAYAGYDYCLQILVTGYPSLRFGLPRVVGSKLEFPIRYSPVLRGRRASLTVTPLSRSCSRGSCRTTSGRPRSRSVVLTSKMISLPLPAKGQGVELALSTTAFQLADAPWTAARATSRPFVLM